MAEIYHVLGLMSGTSLDGLDIALCEFQRDTISGASEWSFRLLEAETSFYAAQWRARLEGAMGISVEALQILDKDIGHDASERILDFLLKHKVEGTIDLITSHGQTIYHNPSEGITTQIGNAAIIAAQTGIQTVADLRSPDVALGGEGAPIVPMGEWHLFPEIDQFINLGGICNITKMNRTDSDSVRAYDICPANGMLNHLVSSLGKNYDEDGQIASSGQLHPLLLDELNALEYYRLPAPKTLDASYYLQKIKPIIDRYSISTEDALHTAVEHLAFQIHSNLNASSVMISGGGALNTFLIERIKAHSTSEIIIPEKRIIEFKEAIIMGFLGLLRLLNEPNIFSSVTGASRDHSSGVIYNAGSAS